jgi:hypothetical protein
MDSLGFVSFGVAALLIPFAYLGALFLTVYLAVRLGIRHERTRDARLGR